jgi:hypothetical protein
VLSDAWKIVLTALFTLIGGVILFLVGQFVQKLLLELAQEQAKAISEVCFRLTYYASWYANPGPRATEDQNNQLQAASDALRECASRLRATTDVIYLYKLLQCIRVVPSRANVEEAIGDLIRLSNSMHTGNGRENREDAHKVMQLLVGRPRIIPPQPL